MKLKRMSWVVRFEVSENWVADGFELTDERALDMLAHDLGYAIPGTELQAKVLRSPSQNRILKIQGYDVPKVSK